MLKKLHFFQRGCFSFAWTLWFQSQNRPRETSLIRGKQALFSQTQPAAPTDPGIFGGAGLKMKLQLRIPDFQSQRSRHVNIPHRPAHLTVGHQQWLLGAGDRPDGMEKCCCGGDEGPGSQGYGWHPHREVPCVVPVVQGHGWQQGLSTSVSVTLILVSWDIFPETSLMPRSTLSSLISVIYVLQNPVP